MLDDFSYPLQPLHFARLSLIPSCLPFLLHCLLSILTSPFFSTVSYPFMSPLSAPLSLINIYLSIFLNCLLSLHISPLCSIVSYHYQYLPLHFAQLSLILSCLIFLLHCLLSILISTSSSTVSYSFMSLLFAPLPITNTYLQFCSTVSYPFMSPLSAPLPLIKTYFSMLVNCLLSLHVSPFCSMAPCSLMFCFFPQLSLRNMCCTCTV